MEVVLASNIHRDISGETVFFDNISGKIAAELAKHGHEAHICPISHSANRLARISDLYLRFPLLADTFAALKRFENCEVLHFMNASLAPAGLFLKNRFRIATVHNLGESYRRLSPAPMPFRYAEMLYWSLFSRVDRSAFHAMDRLVSCSPFQATDLAVTNGLDRSDIRVIPPGVDIGLYRSIPKTDLRSRFGCEEVVAYVGRLHERSKGVSYLIRSMEHIGREGTKLVIVGDGPDRGGYERLVSDLGLGDRVVFLGRCGFEEKCAIQRSADVLVVPSLHEVFCTVFAESLACGVPVVAFDLPFWKGLYDDAALFVGKDPRSLAEGIGRVLDDSGLRNSLVRRGRSLVQRYDDRKVVADYVALYEGLS
jgi:glycosyltransferase involved in cell wall biosynthesis